MARRIVDEEMRFSIIVNGNQAQKELLDLEKANRDLIRSNKANRAEQRKLERQGKQNTARYKELSAEIAKNNTQLKANYAQMNKLEQEVGLTNLTMAQLQRRLKALNIAFRNGGGKEYARQIRETKKAMAALRAQTDISKRGITSLANGFNKYAALGASVIAVLTGVVFKTQQMIDFNKKMADAQSDVRKTTGMTKKEVDELTKSFGILQTRTARINLLKIAEEGGRIGIAKEEIAEFVSIMDKAVVALSDSFPGGVEETASKLGKLKLLFKETKNQGIAEAYNAIGSAINELGASGVATEVNIANFATRIGSLPEGLKPTIDEALGLGAAFEESGIQSEIAGRAYSIFLTKAATETEKFAMVMGVSNEEVKEMINENPVEFFLQFSEVLKDMSATEAATTLDQIGIAADGTRKIIGAASANTERFRETLNLSSESMKEGTSLINEYNVKNNNLAANLDKISKKLRGLFFNSLLTKGLTALVTGFGKLIGAIEKGSGVVEKQTDNFFQLKLKLQDVNTTTEERVKIIKELKAAYPNLLKDLDAETVGNNELNVALEKVNQQLINRLVIAKQQDKIDEQNIQTRDALDRKIKAEFELAKSLRNFENDSNKEIISNTQLTTLEKAQQIRDKFLLKEGGKQGFQFEAQKNGLNELDRIIGTLTRANIDFNASQEAGNNLLSERDKLMQALGINASPPIIETEGVSIENDENDQFNGNIDTSSVKRKEKRKLDIQELYAQERELQNQLIADNFEREMAQLEEQHRQKQDALRSQLVTEGKITEENIEPNGSIRRQMKLQEELFQNQKGAIIERGYQEDIENLQEKFEKESTLRAIRQQEEINALGTNEAAIKAKKEQHRQENLLAEEEHLNNVIESLQSIIDNTEFEGFEIDLLTEKQAKDLYDRINDLKAAVAALNAEKGKLSGDSDDDIGSFGNGAADDVDVLGFSIDQWITTFDNLDSLQDKVAAVGMAVGALTNLYSQYNQIATASDQQRLDRFRANQEQQREALDRRLDQGLINQRQYNQAINSAELELQKKQAEIEYKKAKRDRVAATGNIVANTAMAVAKTIAASPLTGGMPWAAIVGAIGALQLGAVLATPLPAKGFQDGLYPVRREQDGKLFNARYGGESRSGLVDFPTVFMAGEEGGSRPEMIINGTDYNNFSDSFRQSLHRELGRVKGYQEGFYQSDTGSDRFRESNTQDTTASTEADSNIVLAEALNRNSAVLERLEVDGVVAFVSDDMESARKMKERISDYEKYRNKNLR